MSCLNTTNTIETEIFQKIQVLTWRGPTFRANLAQGEPILLQVLELRGEPSRHFNLLHDKLKSQNKKIAGANFVKKSANTWFTCRFLRATEESPLHFQPFRIIHDHLIREIRDLPDTHSRAWGQLDSVPVGTNLVEYCSTFHYTESFEINYRGFEFFSVRCREQLKSLFVALPTHNFVQDVHIHHCLSSTDQSLHLNVWKIHSK